MTKTRMTTNSHDTLYAHYHHLLYAFVHVARLNYNRSTLQECSTTKT